MRAEGFDVAHADGEKARGRVQAASVGGMSRALELFFEVDEGAGDLDEAFVKSVFRAGLAQPEVFEHIVSLVIATGVETLKIPAVAFVIITFPEAEIAEHSFDAVCFFHFLRNIVAHREEIG